MYERYPAPAADEVWSQESRIERLRTITDAFALARADKDGRSGALAAALALTPSPKPSEWAEKEREHGHEIVGFLDAYLAYVPRPLHHYFHFGLTSSDLTEYDLHRAVQRHTMSLRLRVSNLIRVMEELQSRYRDTPRAGRTHGQTAELTFFGHQIEVYSHPLDRINEAMYSILGKTLPAKSPGPTGWSSYWNENEPAGRESVPSTQIIPRDHLIEWMMLYQRLALALENLALFVRCGARSEIGELYEGAERKGSSAMPGKRNPIDSEKVCGLARVARGYFLAIMESYSLWEDRDLSNSSAERISVRGLASVVEHMTDTMIKVMSNLGVDVSRMYRNQKDPATRANQRQTDMQEKECVGPIVASRMVEEEQ